eukprot:COSAG02_NODE_61100_length_269_cov_0.911765_1_plen_72_part_10
MSEIPGDSHSVVGGIYPCIGAAGRVDQCATAVAFTASCHQSGKPIHSPPDGVISQNFAYVNVPDRGGYEELT